MSTTYLCGNTLVFDFILPFCVAVLQSFSDFLPEFFQPRLASPYPLPTFMQKVKWINKRELTKPVKPNPPILLLHFKPILNICQWQSPNTKDVDRQKDENREEKK